MASIDALVEWMLELVSGADLVNVVEDPASAIPVAFPPARVVALAPGSALASDACSCDGHYDDQIVAGVPHLLYSNDRSPRRARFTLLHELGHFVVRHLEPALLDLIDEAAGASGNPDTLEERACHAFAGRLLVPDAELDELIADGRPKPDHVIALYMRRRASWEAAAIRFAERLSGPSAIVIVRNRGSIGFCASSPGLTSWWPRGSALDPSGPLMRATERPARAQPDTFRYDLPGATKLWCDVRQAWPGLGVAVMGDRPSGGQLNLLPATDDEWGRLYCLRCGELREGEWCFECRGARCDECGACGCYRRAPERLCEGACGLLKGLGTFDAGSDVCRDCLG